MYVEQKSVQALNYYVKSLGNNREKLKKKYCPALKLKQEFKNISKII